MFVHQLTYIMKQHISAFIIVFAALTAGVGIAFAGGYWTPVISNSELYWGDSYYTKKGAYVPGADQDWSKVTNPGENPVYSNHVITTAQVKRINWEHSFMDEPNGGKDLQVAHAWYTRKLTNENKPAFKYYSWLGHRILKNKPLVWRNVPASSTPKFVTPMYITPYYNNKWILHYTFVRDQDGNSTLGLPQGVDDYTVDQIGVHY